MRLHHAIAIIAVILIGAGVKLFFLAHSAVAEVRAVKGPSMDVSHMHENTTLAVQSFHDMTFVFSDAD